MPEFLEAIVDKFTFKVATDRQYTDGHLWVKWEAGLVRIGLSDYLQQSSGDVAFAEPDLAGTELAVGDDLGSIETIKVNLLLPSPVSGQIKEINPALEDAPELVNQDPYGAGWLVLVEPADWPTERLRLLSPEAYFELMKADAEQESRQL